MNTNEQKQPVNDWPRAEQFRKSIRLEFSLYVSAVILLLMLATGYIITEKYVATVSQNVVERLLTQARAYSSSAGKLIISTNGPDELLLNNICKKLVENNSDIYWAGITNQEGTFIAHTDIKQVIAGAKMDLTSDKHSYDFFNKDETFMTDRALIEITVPISEGGIIVGRLGLASSTRQIIEARDSSILTVASITVFMLLLGIPLTTLILNRKLRPIKQITGALKNVSYEDIKLEFPFVSKNEFGYLAETLKAMGRRLNVAQKSLIEKERLSRELEIAREIQANILPRSFPHAGSYEFAGFYSSAKEVGGDYYDFINFGDERIAFLVADVSGKSLPGMLVMLLTRDIIKQLGQSIFDPGKLLTEVNKELLTGIRKGMFVTMFYGLLNKRTGRFVFASAGHNPLIRVDGQTGRCEMIKTRGYPLGMIASEKFEERIETGEIQLADNDWLVQFTDGINEAQNETKEEFGMERFAEAIKNNIRLSPGEMIENIMQQHKNFVGETPQYDDITLMSLKWFGRKAAIESARVKETANAL
jgi:serine phosphatase RsbU (regulator of sigma subunit)/uncharacterized protein (UPF0333 family)